MSGNKDDARVTTEKHAIKMSENIRALFDNKTDETSKVKMTDTDHPATEETLEMAIIGSGPPMPEFEFPFANNLQKALTIALYEIEDNPIPVFDEFKLTEQKYIRVICVNEYSKRWLIDAVKKLSPFEGQPLLVVADVTVPKLRLFHLFVPFNNAINDARDMLVKIKKSTPVLKSEFWKVRYFNWNLKDNGSAGKVEIDESSIKFIKEHEYAVHLGMGKAYFWDPINRTGCFYFD